MTIECMYGECPHHGCNQTPPEEGPFCFENQCRALKSDIARWDLAKKVQTSRKVQQAKTFEAMLRYLYETQGRSQVPFAWSAPSFDQWKTRLEEATTKHEQAKAATQFDVEWLNGKAGIKMHNAPHEGPSASGRRVSHLCENPWLEAAVAWEVCASIHERYAKGKDALYSTRRKDFLKHAEDARKMANVKVSGPEGGLPPKGRARP